MEFMFGSYMTFIYPSYRVINTKICNFWILRSYKKKKKFFLLFYVFFDVESKSEVRFGRSPLVFEL